MSHSKEAWKRLGDLLTERRVQISPEYRNRLKFVADTGLHERLVSDLERGRRESYRDTSLQAVEIAYRLLPGSIIQSLDSGALSPLEPVVQVSQVRLDAPEPASPGVRIEQYDDTRLRIGITVDTDVGMDEAIASLGDLSPNEHATAYMLKGMDYSPAEVAGAVLLLRRLSARRATRPSSERREA